MANTITVYKTQSCQMCRATTRKLDNAGAEYTEIFVDAPENAELAEQIRLRSEELGVLSQAPYVTVYNDKNQLIDDWFGFQPDKINAATQEQ